MKVMKSRAMPTIWFVLLALTFATVASGQPQTLLRTGSEISMDKKSEMLSHRRFARGVSSLLEEVNDLAGAMYLQNELERLRPTIESLMPIDGGVLAAAYVDESSIGESKVRRLRSVKILGSYTSLDQARREQNHMHFATGTRTLPTVRRPNSHIQTTPRYFWYAAPSLRNQNIGRSARDVIDENPRTRAEPADESVNVDIHDPLEAKGKIKKTPQSLYSFQTTASQLQLSQAPFTRSRPVLSTDRSWRALESKAFDDTREQQNSQSNVDHNAAIRGKQTIDFLEDERRIANQTISEIQEHADRTRENGANQRNCSLKAP
jgi:hypothetical protein